MKKRRCHCDICTSKRKTKMDISIRVANPDDGNMGNYDDECEEILRKTRAQVTCLIVLSGSKGTGFSLATVNPGLIKPVAAALREVADKLEKQSSIVK